MGLFYLQPLNHKHQFGPGHTMVVSCKDRGAETALFQAFVIQHKTTGLPVQELEMGAVSVQKNKYIPTGRFPAQFVLDQTAQAIERFAHVAGPWVKIVGVVRAQGKH